MKIIITLLIILSPSITLASSANVKLEQYLNQQKTEISKIQILKSNCTEDEWKNKLNTFLHEEIDNPSLVSVINSYFMNFQWNHCFSRDLEKLKSVETFATNKIFNLSKTCSDKNDIEKIKTIRRDIVYEKNNFNLKTSKFWNPSIYWSWSSATKCKEDPSEQLNESVKKFKDKFKNWSTFDPFSFKENLSNKWWELQESTENSEIDKRAESRAKSWLEKNVNSYIPISWYRATFSEKKANKIDDSTNKNIKKSDEGFFSLFNDISNLFVPWKSVKTFSREVDQVENEKQIIDYNLQNIWENHILINLEEDSSDNIISELWLLERSIIVSNWNKQELKQIAETTNQKNIKNFIKVVLNVLKKHNRDVNIIPELKYWDY